MQCTHPFDREVKQRVVRFVTCTCPWQRYGPETGYYKTKSTREDEDLDYQVMFLDLIRKESTGKNGRLASISILIACSR